MIATTATTADTAYYDIAYTTAIKYCRSIVNLIKKPLRSSIFFFIDISIYSRIRISRRYSKRMRRRFDTFY